MTEKISTDKAPAALGPYTQAIKAGNTLYVSGSLGIDPASGKLVGDTIETQTEQVSKNVQAILEAAGYALGDVVKVTAYLSNLEDFSDFNRVYAQYFDSEPARTCVAAAKLLRDTKVVLDVTAVKG